jgi:hypothetical protein
MTYGRNGKENGMTCIAALVKDKKVYMGADSAGLAGYHLGIRADRKIFMNSGFLFGFTSSFRMGQLLQYSFKPPPFKGRDLDRFMVRDFIEAVRKCLSKGGLVRAALPKRKTPSNPAARF